MKKLYYFSIAFLLLSNSLLADINKTDHIQFGPSIGFSFMGINTLGVPDHYKNWPIFTDRYNASLSAIVPLFRTGELKIITNFSSITFPFGFRYSKEDVHDEWDYFAHYYKYGLAITYNNFILGIDYATSRGIKTYPMWGGSFNYAKDTLKNNLIISLGGMAEFWKSPIGSFYINPGIYYCVNDVFKEGTQIGVENFNSRPISFNILVSYMFNIYKIRK
jgi:hypothetical protein